MLRRYREWKADRQVRQDDKAQIDIMRDVWGPWPHAEIDRWDHRRLTAMIVSGELPPDGKAYAESRLRIIEQELGPAGRAALWAKWALVVSILSAAVALAALWRA